MSRLSVFRTDYGVSALASLILGITMLATKWLAAAALPPEMLFNFTAKLLGVPAVFNFVHSLPFGVDRYAKFVLFGVTVALFLIAWLALGLLYRRLAARIGNLLSIVLYGIVMVASVAFILLPIQGLGLFGLSAGNFLYPPLSTHLWAATFGLVFGIARWALEPRPFTRERREALRGVAHGLLAITFGASLVGLLRTGLARAQELMGFLGSVVGLSPEITPTRDHYVVSKNVFNPSVSERGWNLKITGMVDNELVLTLDDLKALPSVERASTLTCISNTVGGKLIGNSVWTGVRLADLLRTAGVQRGANELILRAADNYSDSFVLEEALREGTIVAYLQNGEQLTRDHGFPARVLVPGIYGMKNVKWVQEIELAAEDHLGYWQTRGWSDLATVLTMSRIDTGKATLLPDGTAAIGGIAFAGLRGVDRVEVSVDGGTTWQRATLDEPVNDLSWTLWGFRWEADPGTYEVLVRATDGDGITQTSKRQRALPDGATGYHRRRVTVPG